MNFFFLFQNNQLLCRNIHTKRWSFINKWIDKWYSVIIFNENFKWKFFLSIVSYNTVECFFFFRLSISVCVFHFFFFFFFWIYVSLLDSMIISNISHSFTRSLSIHFFFVFLIFIFPLLNSFDEHFSFSFKYIFFFCSPFISIIIHR